MTQTARPTSSFTAGTSFTSVTFTLPTSINDQSDASYVTKSAGATRSNYGEFADLSDPGLSSGHLLWARRLIATNTGSCTLQLWQGNPTAGGTLIATLTLTEDNVLANESLTLSGAEADAITNYADLWWELDANGSITPEVYEVWLEVPDPVAPRATVVVVGVSSSSTGG